MEVEDGTLFAPFESYRRFQSPFCLRPVEAFTMHQGGGAQLVIVYENNPGACKLSELIKALRPDDYVRFISGWVSQLICLLHSAHRAGLAFDDILCIDNLLVSFSLEV